MLRLCVGLAQVVLLVVKFCTTQRRLNVDNVPFSMDFAKKNAYKSY